MQKFDEYKFFIDDTARLSERRQTVTNTYITVNGAIIGLITFFAKDAGLVHWSVVIAILPLIAAGGIVCYFWYRLLFSYRRLIGFRFIILQQMEEELPESSKMYTRESEKFYEKAPKQQQISISRIEMLLPRLFGIVYIGLLLLDLLLVIALAFRVVS